MNDIKSDFKPRNYVLIAFILVAMAIVSVFSYLTLGRFAISDSAAREIELGMTRKEVHRRIGKPHDSYSHREIVELYSVWGQSDMLFIVYSNDSDEGVVEEVY